jgi:anti-sigma factor RsiW
MRCAQAQELMTATVDGELSPRQRGAFEAHLASCAACRDELTATERMLAALEALPMETEVPVLLEQETLRRVRIEAAEEAERRAANRWWTRLRVPAVAVTALAALVLVIVGHDEGRRKAEVARTPAAAAKPAAEDLARARPTKAEERVAAASAPAPVAQKPKKAPSGPPPELAARPDLFMELPILRNMEKLEHFEQIETTTVEGQPRSEAAPEQQRG